MGPSVLIGHHSSTHWHVLSHAWWEGSGWGWACHCHPHLEPVYHIPGSLQDSSGRILVPGIYEHVAPLTEKEKRMYEAVDLDLEEYRNSSRVRRFLFDTKVGWDGASRVLGSRVL